MKYLLTELAIHLKALNEETINKDDFVAAVQDTYNHYKREQ